MNRRSPSVSLGFDLLVPRLMREFHLSEKEPRELVELLGTDWASLVTGGALPKG